MNTIFKTLFNDWKHAVRTFCNIVVVLLCPVLFYFRSLSFSNSLFFCIAATQNAKLYV